MKRWGRHENRNEGQVWDLFDDVASLSSTAVLPSTSVRLSDDLLGEIDGLLGERDFLIGFWQAPGE